MTRDEQRLFVLSLTESIANAWVLAIDKGDVPAEWDGHELRVALADTFSRDAECSVLRQSPRSARTRAYRRDRAAIGRI